MANGELEVAIAAARAGGAVLRRSYNTGVTVRYKGPVDLVTQVDTESEQVVTGMLHDAYPTYGILAEEGGGSVGEEDARWIVDPLDGTTNYTHAFPFFAVAIALSGRGRSRSASCTTRCATRYTPQNGVVARPATGRRYGSRTPRSCVGRSSRRASRMTARRYLPPWSFGAG